MGIVLWIIIGGIAGWVASMVMRSEYTTIEDIILGMAGGFVGGFILNAIGINGITSYNFFGFIVAIGGAIVLIFLGRLLHR